MFCNTCDLSQKLWHWIYHEIANHIRYLVYLLATSNSSVLQHCTAWSGNQRALSLGPEGEDSGLRLNMAGCSSRHCELMGQPSNNSILFKLSSLIWGLLKAGNLSHLCLENVCCMEHWDFIINTVTVLKLLTFALTKNELEQDQFWVFCLIRLYLCETSWWTDFRTCCQETKGMPLPCLWYLILWAVVARGAREWKAWVAFCGMSWTDL